MMILDSNVWIALYLEEDSQHKKALKLAPSFRHVAIPEYVILETCTILLVKAGENASEKFLDYVFDNREVTVLFSTREFFQETIRVFRGENGKKLSAIDASLLYLSGEHEVITFDKDLEKAIKNHTKKNAKN